MDLLPMSQICSNEFSSFICEFSCLTPTTPVALGSPLPLPPTRPPDVHHFSGTSRLCSHTSLWRGAWPQASPAAPEPADATASGSSWGRGGQSCRREGGGGRRPKAWGEGGGEGREGKSSRGQTGSKEGPKGSGQGTNGGEGKW